MLNVDRFGNTFDMWRYYTATLWRGGEERRTKAMDSVTEVPSVNCLKQLRIALGNQKARIPIQGISSRLTPGHVSSEMKRQLGEKVRKGTSTSFHEQY